jgi:hypothetical protein
MNFICEVKRSDLVLLMHAEPDTEILTDPTSPKRFRSRDSIRSGSTRDLFYSSFSK